MTATERRIDIFWFDDATSRLCLLLAYLMCRMELWEEAKIRVLAPRKKISEAYEKQLAFSLEEMRIDCISHVIEYPDYKEVSKLCKDSSLVFLPFKLKASKPDSPIAEDISLLVSELPATALVLAAEDIDLTAEPNEGKPAEAAAAVDAVIEAQENLKEAEETVEKAEIARDEVSGGKKALNKQIEILQEAQGKAKRAKLKVEKKAKKAEELGIIIETVDEDNSDKS